jgi:DNA-binding beta-propeller fold protein YncE
VWPRRRWLAGAVAAAAVLAAGCAQVPVEMPRATVAPLVFPPAPDEPRFVYERTLYGAPDVVVEDAATELRRKVTGEVRVGDMLSKPYGVAVYQGKILVTDTVSRYVLVLDVPNGRTYRIGDAEGPNALVKPIGIDVDAKGNVYVADISQKQIIVYDTAGKLLKKIGGPEIFDRLTSVTVNPEGTLIYAVDIGGVSSERHVVRVFDADGKHTMDIGRRGTGPGEFNLPRDLAIGKDGRLYVVDGGNFRVVVFDRHGKYLTAFGSVGRWGSSRVRKRSPPTCRATSTWWTRRSETSRFSTRTVNCCCSSASARNAMAPRATCCRRASPSTRTAASTWSTSGSGRSTSSARRR